MLGIALPLFSSFYETLNELIYRMHDAGLIGYELKLSFSPKNHIKNSDDIGAEVLTMEHLDIAFKIILIAIGISVFGFFAEILVFQFCKMLKWRLQLNGDYLQFNLFQF